MSKKIITLMFVLSIPVLLCFLALTVHNGEISLNWMIIELIRMPDVVMSSLGVLGTTIATMAIHQLTKNKIADPGTIGMTSMNFMMLMIIYGFSSLNIYIYVRDYVMPFVYFVTSGIVLIVLYSLTYHFRYAANKIILIGIVFSLTISAISQAILANLDYAKKIYLSTAQVGGISSGYNILNWISTYVAIGFLGLSIILYFVFSKQIKIVYSDPIKAATIGIKIKFIRAVLFVVVALSSAASFVCIGNLTFVGFVASSIAYVLVRQTGWFQFVISLLCGLSLIYFVYIMKQNVIPQNVPFGIVSNVIVLPYVVFLLWRGEKNE